jgi:hypothetical protein
MQMAEAQAKVEEAQARADKAKSDAKKAAADAEKAEYEAKTAKANWAQTHMDNLRDVERHDQDMARGHVNHSRDHAHAMDRHGADMTIMGIEAHRAGEQHDASMEQITQPEPASVQ